MLGGLGIVVGLIVYFAWRKSENRYKRGCAYLFAVWIGLSVTFLLIRIGLLWLYD